MTVDPECVKLAEYFVENGTDAQVKDLAWQIQGFVNDVLQNVEFAKDAKRQDAADRAAGI